MTEDEPSLAELQITIQRILVQDVFKSDDYYEKETKDPFYQFLLKILLNYEAYEAEYFIEEVRVEGLRSIHQQMLDSDRERKDLDIHTLLTGSADEQHYALALYSAFLNKKFQIALFALDDKKLGEFLAASLELCGRLFTDNAFDNLDVMVSRFLKRKLVRNLTADHRVLEWVCTAEYLMTRNAYPVAIGVCETLLDSDSKMLAPRQIGWILALAGESYSSIGDIPMALELLYSALDVLPRDTYERPWVQAVMGVLFYNIKKERAARELLYSAEKALDSVGKARHYPLYIYVKRYLVLAYLLEGKIEEAGDEMGYFYASKRWFPIRARFHGKLPAGLEFMIADTAARVHLANEDRRHAIRSYHRITEMDDAYDALRAYCWQEIGKLYEGSAIYVEKRRGKLLAMKQAIKAYNRSIKENVETQVSSRLYCMSCIARSYLIMEALYVDVNSKLNCIKLAEKEVDAMLSDPNFNTLSHKQRLYSYFIAARVYYVVESEVLKKEKTREYIYYAFHSLRKVKKKNPKLFKTEFWKEVKEALRDLLKLVNR